MSFFDLNTADTSTGGGGELIPDNTVVRAILNVRPGGAGEGGWCKMSKTGGLMLDCEWTVTDGPYARRKVWRYMMLSGSEKAVEISKSQLRAVVEGHHGIMPEDMSEAAQAKRRVQIADFDGMEACLLIGIEKQEGYEPKNSVKAVLTPADRRFIKRGGAAPAAVAAPGFAPAPAPAAAPVNRPAWA